MESKLLSFPKVNRIDKPALKDVLDGFVYILEKVDGSQFRILIDPKTQTWDCGSKSVDGKENIDYKMFDVAIKRAEEVAERYFENFDDPIVLYCGDFLMAELDKHSDIVLDFRNVEFISRSVARKLLTYKLSHPEKKIEFINMCESVEMMLQIVERQLMGMNKSTFGRHTIEL